MTAKLVADSRILSAAKMSGFPANTAAISDLRPGDHILVFSHASDNAGKPTIDGGLRWLEEVLRHKGLPDGVQFGVVGFLPPDDYGDLIYLVSGEHRLPYRQLPCSAAALKECDTAEASIVLRIAASERRLEIAFATERHKLRGLAAAVRIYLGALAIGHAPLEGAVPILLAAQCEARKSREGLGGKIDVNEIVRLVREHHSFKDLLQNKGPLPARYEKAKPAHNAWMADDQHMSNLWSDVLPQIFTGRVKTFGDWDAMKVAMTAMPPQPSDIVILDCNLGGSENEEVHDGFESAVIEPRSIALGELDEPIVDKESRQPNGDSTPSGLSRLAELRAVFPHIHVVMMSAFDDAQLALTALRAGADRYFVKQLQDKGNRSSIDYYEQFIECIGSGNADAIKLRALMESYNARMAAGSASQASGVPSPKTLNSQIKLAFYLGFSVHNAENVTRPSGYLNGLSTTSVPRSIVNVLQVGWLDDPHTGKSFGPVSWPGEVSSICKNAKHGRPITMSDALKVLGGIIGRLTPCAAALNWGKAEIPPFSPYTEEALRANGNRPGQKFYRIATSEVSAGKRAAIELSRGIACNQNCCHSIATVQDIVGGHNSSVMAECTHILAIGRDDDLTGWFHALHAGFPGIQRMSSTELLGLELQDLANRLKRTHVVILDLQLPSTTLGWIALERLSIARPGLAIIVASDSNDFVNAARSLRRGACDYLSKTLHVPRESWLECAAFTLKVAAIFRLTANSDLLRVGVLRRRVARVGKRDYWKTQISENIEWDAIRRARDPFQSRYEATHHIVVSEDDCVLPDPILLPKMTYDTLMVVVALLHATTTSGVQEPLIPPTEKRSFEYGEESGDQPRAFQPLTNRRETLLPLDHWRAQLLLGGSANIAKLVAVMACGLIEMLAKWRFCKNAGSQMIERRWGNGSGEAWSIDIDHEMQDPQSAHFVYQARNAALYPGSLHKSLPPGLKWSREGIVMILEWTLDAIEYFRNTM